MAQLAVLVTISCGVGANVDAKTQLAVRVAGGPGVGEKGACK